jgi:hypothetical protein
MAGVGDGGSGVALRGSFQEVMDADFDAPAALDVLDAAATRVLSGAADTGEQEALRDSLATLGFAFAGARGPATGHLASTL